MALGFGLVGIDRFLITTLFPTIAKELHLDYGDIGVITGALAVAWGLAALVMGNLADHVGRRRVLTGALVLFSLLIGASGLAAGLLGLVLVRVVMGVADGAYTPASITATIESSPPERHGINIGIQQMMLPLCGLGLGPLLVGDLLAYINWRLIFLVFVLPGLLLAFAVWRVIPAKTATHRLDRSDWAGLTDWRKVLRIRNIRVASAMMLCWLTCLMTTSAFLPNYLIDHVHLPFVQMSRVMSAIGVGSTAGTLLLPWLSDKVGRKPVMVLAAVGALGGLLSLALGSGTVGGLFASLFIIHFFNNALITLTVGPLCLESVPAGYGATASGLVIAIAELFGGGLAPALAGQLALHFGVANILWPPIVMMALGILLALAVRETRPRVPR
jgi:MFS family permease